VAVLNGGVMVSYVTLVRFPARRGSLMAVLTPRHGDENP
jgi:hypothetical protein